MTRKIALLFLAIAMPLTGCNKVKSLPFLNSKKQEAVVPAPPPVAVVPPAQATSAKADTPVPAPVDAPKSELSRKSSAMVLCYHRFEDRPKDSLAIKPSEFEEQMQQIKDNGFTVVSMKDFLAWRRGEKEIPDKSCLISIDDGYRSGYDVAWPILKKFGYPFTMFIYTNYVKGQPKSGGQSLSWEELAEMRDAGVDIESHTVSHLDLRAKKGRTPEVYEQWVREELLNSKKMLEQQLGISVKCLAYPFGNHNAEVRKVAMESGYEVAFSVYGQRLTYHSQADSLGRYAVESTKPQIFQSAIKMLGGGGSSGDETTPMLSQLAAASMVTQPMEGETVTDPSPVIKANLATLGEIDPGSVALRLSGVGEVASKYDAATKMVEGKVSDKLHEPYYVVTLTARVKGRKVEVKWNFNYNGPGLLAVDAAHAPAVDPAAVPAKAVPAKSVTPTKKPKK